MLVFRIKLVKFTQALFESGEMLRSPPRFLLGLNIARDFWGCGQRADNVLGMIDVKFKTDKYEGKDSYDRIPSKGTNLWLRDKYTFDDPRSRNHSGPSVSFVLLWQIKSVQKSMWRIRPGRAKKYHSISTSQISLKCQIRNRYFKDTEKRFHGFLA